jgi:hypothetical protein
VVVTRGVLVVLGKGKVWFWFLLLWYMRVDVLS